MKRFSTICIVLILWHGMLGADEVRAAKTSNADTAVLQDRIVTLEKTVANLEQQISRLIRAMEGQQDVALVPIPSTAAAEAVPTSAPSAPEDVADSPTQNLLKSFRIFGFFSTRYEKAFSVPMREAGRTVERDLPGEFSFPFFHLMASSELSPKYRVFLNISGDGDEDLSLSNFWGEYTKGRAFNVRIGKSYRKFGLYNEILDAVPTYLGVEPPELFDSDHLLVSRTANLMLHGKTPIKNGIFGYSVSLDDGEGSRPDDSYPVSFDLNYTSPSDAFTIGTSAYHSIGRTKSGVRVGEGSPNGGVLPWMESDRFDILGGYVEGRLGALTLQAAYWRSSHDGIRNPAATVEVIENTDLNDGQLSRFLRDVGSPVTEANIETRAIYDIETWYLRAGYSVETRIGEFVPYIFWDWYSNPETIAEKDFGGDNEAGLADDGEFHKPTIGLVYRPIHKLAIKLDGSSHIFRMNGEHVSFPELRLDFSFLFGH